MFGQTRISIAVCYHSRNLDFFLPAKKETNCLLRQHFKDFQGTGMTLDLQHKFLLCLDLCCWVMEGLVRIVFMFNIAVGELY